MSKGKPKKAYKIPFDADGNLIDYIDAYWQPGEGESYVDNYVFDDGLAVMNYFRGRSAANFILRSANDGRRYTIFLTDFMEALTLANAYKADVDGKSRMVLVGLWEFIKRGANFGVRMLAGGGPSSASA